jgi:hypothetical protein
MKARLHDAHVVYSARRWRESPNTALCAMGSVRRCKSVRAVRMCKVAKRRGEEDNAPVTNSIHHRNGSLGRGVLCRRHPGETKIESRARFARWSGGRVSGNGQVTGRLRKR